MDALASSGVFGTSGASPLPPPQAPATGGAGSAAPQHAALVGYERAVAAARVAPVGTSFSTSYATALEPFDGAACGTVLLASATHLVCGVPSRFVYPANAAVYVGGFGVAELRPNLALDGGRPLRLVLKDGDGDTAAGSGKCTGKVVVRAVRHLDLYHYYVLACAREVNAERPHLGASYRVVKVLAEHALPFDRPMLAALLQRELGFTRRRAADTARHCESLDIDVLRDGAGDGGDGGRWFADLYERSAYFVETHVRRLEATWPRKTLALVERSRLGELERLLVEDPLQLCFWWLAGAGGGGAGGDQRGGGAGWDQRGGEATTLAFGESLPELSEAQLVAAAPRRYTRHASAEAALELECVRFYAFLKRHFHGEAHLYAPALDARHGERVRAFLASPACAFGVEHRFFRVITHYGCECVYAYGDAARIERLRAAVLRIASAPALAEQRAKPRRASRHDVELTTEQRLACENAIKKRWYAIAGGAGCGKTSTAREIYTHFEEGEVLCLAFMGLTAELMAKRIGANAMTIDKCVRRIEAARALHVRRRARALAAGAEAVAAFDAKYDGDADAGCVVALRPRRLLFDEFSTLDVALVERALTALLANGAPLEGVTFLGDVRQNPPIGRGALMPAFLGLYGAARFCELRVNHRVSAESRLLVRNLDRAAAGAPFAEYELSRDLTSDHPFLFIERPSTLAAAVELLAPLLEGAVAAAVAPGSAPRTAQLLVQRNAEREEFNRLFARRAGRTVPPGHFGAGDRVMFLRNANGSGGGGGSGGSRGGGGGANTVPAHLRVHAVNNGTVARLVRIEDVCVDAEQPARAVAHTGVPPTRFRGGLEGWRFLRFVVEGADADSSGAARVHALSLHDYALDDVTLATATTNTKFQGGEADTVAVYVHAGAGMTETFARSDFIVALSRARRRVILVASSAPRPEFGGRTEVEQLTQRDARVRYEMLGTQLPSEAALRAAGLP